MSKHNYLAREQEALTVELELTATSQTLTSAQLRNAGVIVANKSSAITITLPAAASQYEGMKRHVINKGAGTLTLAVAAGFGGSATTSVTMAQGGEAVVLCDGDYWYVDMPAGTDLTAAEMAAINGANAPAALNVFATMADVIAGGTLADGKIVIGNGSNVATAVTPAGDVTIANDGATAIAGDSIINADVKTTAAIAYSKLATLATGSILAGNAGTPTATVVGGDVTIGATGTVTIAAGAVTSAKLAGAIDPGKVTLTSAHIVVGNGSNVGADVAVSGDIAITNAGVASIAADCIVDADVNTGAAIALSKLGADDLGSFTGAIVPGTDAIMILDAGTLKSSTYQVIMDGVEDLTAFTGAVAPATDKVLISDNGTAKASTVQVLFDGVGDLTAETIATTDSLLFIDSTDGAAKIQTIDGIATFMAGTASSTGLSATNGVLSVDLGSLTSFSGAVVPGTDEVPISDGGVDKAATYQVFMDGIGDLTAAVIATTDVIPFIDADDGAAKIESIDDLFGIGPALTTEATVAVADDYMLFLDGGATGAAKKEKIADLVALMAGAGLDATNGVLAVGTQRVTTMIPGTWEVAGDAAEGNFAGLDQALDITQTEAAAAFAKSYNHDNTKFANIAVTAGQGEWTANYQLFPDVEVENDACYFGAAVPFCQAAFDLSATVATYNGAAASQIWEYSKGSTVWGTLTLKSDSTDVVGGAAVGQQPFGSDGAITFIPPSDWATDTVDGQEAYWIRCRCTAAVDITQIPILDAHEHYVCTPTDGFKVPIAGTITGMRLRDGATTVHTATDVKFVLMNFTTGACTAEQTFPQDKRMDSFGSLALAVAAGDIVWPVVTQEDGTNEVTNAVLEFELTAT